ncbi:carbohydrate kinase [Brevibacillus sp. HB2.2]|uniref:carbohydrate kinase family protein n=1 Tax=Brevibacillus sp. HB2.2 TaxID=2738846 RepID=UPI00156ACCE2|nr:carbohydrate kinase [Brevibacillus sp. HB2.2]NRS48702.1 carbohydrate kinase [Brevibacillus sp. HB2.2]
MVDVVACGELLIDFTPVQQKEKPGSIAFEQNPGGAPANVLAALSRFGKRTSFIGAVGNDVFGRFLQQTLIRLNIGTEGLVLTEEAPTTLAFVHLDETGDRSFHFYRNPGADILLREQDVNESLIAQAAIFHFGTLSLTHEPARSATWKAVEYAKQHQRLLSFDPNIRASLWEDLEEAKALALKGMAQADIVKLSEEELAFLVGSEDVVEATAWMLGQYDLQAVFVTLGEKGCFYRTRNHFGTVGGFQVTAIDTTGAGDAFVGALLYQLLEVGESMLDILQATLEDMVRFANAAGALTTTRSGAIPAMPTLSEVKSFMEATR